MNKVLSSKLYIAIFLGSFLLMSFQFFAQESDSWYEYYEGNERWLTIKSSENLSADQIINRLNRELFKFSNDDALKLHRETTDSQGDKHLHYRHYYKGIPVVGSEFKLHYKSDRIEYAYSTIRSFSRLEATPAISSIEAVNQAILYSPDNLFSWNIPGLEKLLKESTKNPQATHYPTATLQWVQYLFDTDSRYQLAYKVSIHSYQPFGKTDYFINPFTGKILFDHHACNTNSKPAITKTKYYGERPIITDSIGVNQYTLFDATRAPGIRTVNANQSEKENMVVDFLNDSTYWENTTTNQLDVGGGLHWATSQFHDFLNVKLGRPNIDSSLQYIAVAHYGDKVNNAFWNGQYAVFGDGDGIQYSSLATLDVVGHEFSHGLNDFTADLIYMNESGALDESFADILGNATEAFADSTVFSWLLAEKSTTNNRGIRNMADPRTHNHPNYYKGENWNFTSSDNGGVHTNSSVQNYWFYMLSTGASGLTIAGDEYTIDSLGMDKALLIAYSNLNHYLGANSTYQDARIGADLSAQNIFGSCSEEHRAVLNAWHVVGLGDLAHKSDWSIIDLSGPNDFSCEFKDKEPLAVTLVYKDCIDSVSVGTKIPLAYQVNNLEEILDTMIISQVVYSGDTLVYNFPDGITTMDKEGEYELRVSVQVPTDIVRSNNSLTKIFEREMYQNTDVALKSVVHPRSSCFKTVDTVAVEVTFQGCDLLAQGTEIELFYTWEGESFNMTHTVDKDIARNESFIIKFVDGHDFSSYKKYPMNFQIQYAADTLLENNAIKDFVVQHPVVFDLSTTLTFDGVGESTRDSFYILKGNAAQVSFKNNKGFKKSNGFYVTGSRGIDALVSGEAELPVIDNLWKTNDEYKTQICICADLSGYKQAELSFRSKQTYSKLYKDKLNKDIKNASAFRVLINGYPVSGTYKPSSYQSIGYPNRKLDISKYTGGNAELCFETFTLTAPEHDTLGKGDQIFIDNIVIKASNQVATSKTDYYDLRIFPNPSTGKFSFQSTSLGAGRIELYNVQGQKVFQEDRQSNTVENIIETTGLKAGVYFLSFSNDKYKIVRKILISR